MERDRGLLERGEKKVNTEDLRTLRAQRKKEISDSCADGNPRWAMEFALKA